MPRHHAPPTDAPDTLPGILDDVWARLAEAVGSARRPFHLPTLCTVEHAGLPDARVVVLREADRHARQLRCHTDLRSPKVAHLRRVPTAAWLFYDADARLQVRATTAVTIHTGDALARRRWDASDPSARRCYLAPASPGQACAAPSPNLPEAVRQRVPGVAESEPGLVNFAVLSAVVTAFDVLYLHHAGHRRARFVWSPGSAEPASSWLEP